MDGRMLEEVLSTALSGGGDFADILIEEIVATQVFLEDEKIERLNTGEENGAGIRVIEGKTTAYAHTNDLSREGLLAVAQLVSAAMGGKGQTQVRLNELKTNTPAIERSPKDVPIEDKVGMVERVNQEARQVGKEIRQVTVSYQDTVRKTTIANSEGTFLSGERIRTTLVCHAIAAGDGIMQTGYEAMGGTVGYELYSQQDPLQLGRVAAQRAVKMLSAKPAPSGRMPVVLAGEAGGTMIHEACGHGLEADLVQQGMSLYAGRVGEKVASELVTVIDDATLPGKFGSYVWDDEGSPAQRTVLIENGVLKGFLHDRLTARQDGVPSTGNGRRQSYSHRPYPRMSNTFLASGSDDPQKIISDTPQGLLVTRMGGGQVDTANGDFVFEVSEGFLIEGGKVGPMVRGATLTGNGPKVLSLVDRVASDPQFTIGICGKYGQGVPVTDAQPTMRIEKLLVGGVGEDPPGEGGEL